jgi:hypothetical protein
MVLVLATQQGYCMKNITIHDILWSPVDLTVAPTGEAANAGNRGAAQTAAEREDTTKRLIDRACELVKKALASSPPQPSTPTTTNITRVSTPEFFFYTEEPLSIKEFESVVDRMEKSVTTRPDANLVLGSFAVQTPSGQVMNVTPHITGGETPRTQLIVKSYTSPIDVLYERPASIGPPGKFPALDGQSTASLPPGIRTEAGESSFTFNNLVHRDTPDGARCITAVDICLDHFFHVALDNLKALPEASQDSPVSHMLVSCTLKPIPSHSIGEIVHADPYHSMYVAPDKVAKISSLEVDVPCFGQPAGMFKYEPKNLPNLGDSLKDRELTEQATNLYQQKSATLLLVLETLSSDLDKESKRLDKDKGAISQIKAEIVNNKIAAVKVEIARIRDTDSSPSNDNSRAGLDKRMQQSLTNVRNILQISQRDMDILSIKKNPLLDKLMGKEAPKSALVMQQAVANAKNTLNMLNIQAPSLPSIDAQSENQHTVDNDPSSKVPTLEPSEQAGAGASADVPSDESNAQFSEASEPSEREEPEQPNEGFDRIPVKMDAAPDSVSGDGYQFPDTPDHVPLDLPEVPDEDPGQTSESSSKNRKQERDDPVPS